LLATGSPPHYPALASNLNLSERTDLVFYYCGETGRDLCSIRLNGAEQGHVVSGPVDEYKVAKDGASVAVRIAPGERCVLLYLATGTRNEIANCLDIEPSPDSAAAAIRSPEGGYEVYLPAKNSRHKLDGLHIHGDNPLWSRDSTGILVFDEPCKKYLAVDVASGDISQLDKEQWIEQLSYSTYDSRGLSWLKRVSPSMNYLASVKRGSLYVTRIGRGGGERCPLENVGGYWPDSGQPGFLNPRWSADERYIVGQIGDEMVAVDVKKIGGRILGKGSHPLIIAPTADRKEDAYRRYLWRLTNEIAH
jgi:hypothetical protein